MANTSSGRNPMARVMSNRDFRLLFSGAATSFLGDQFALIATPWLVLKMTGNPAALGLVLALEGIPRALLMLFGGAIADRLSPRLLMLIANVTRFVLTALMAFLVATGLAQLWMIYAFGLLFGIVAGFAVPAETSIVPTLVGGDDLQAGNSLMMGVAQLVGFVGPTVAGLLIGRFAGSLEGVSVAFAIDAATFVVSAVTLLLIRTGRRQTRPSVDSEKESVLVSIRNGISYLWSTGTLRLMFLVLTVANFALIGPIMVGIPVLAHERLAQGATAFGLLMSAYAGGNLVGYLAAGALPHPGGATIRGIMIVLFAAFSLVIGALGYITSTWMDFALLLLVGLGNGYIAIVLITWMQASTPKVMLGRIMSLLMLSSTGLAPISQALSGVVAKLNLTLLFVTAAVLTLIVTIWMAFRPELRQLGDGLTRQSARKGWAE